MDLNQANQQIVALQQQCRTLKNDLEQKQKEIEELRRQRAELMGALFAPTGLDFDYDLDELLEQTRNQQPLLEFLAELEAGGNPSGR